jgi:MFS family permease
MVAIQAPREAFDIGRVTQRTFEVIGRNIVPFGIMAVLLGGVPTVLLTWWQMATVTTGPIPHAPVPVTLVSLVVKLALFGVLQASIVYGSIRDLEGRRPDLGEMATAGLRAAVPAIGVGILFSFAIAFGTILFIVPGAMLASAWIAALPAAVVERTGIFAAFGRSAELTKGSRWRIFALLVVYFLILMLAGLVVGGLSGGLLHPLRASLGGAGLASLLLTTLVLNVVYYLVATTLVAVIYQELRTIREGVAPADLAGVFD